MSWTDSEASELVLRLNRGAGGGAADVELSAVEEAIVDIDEDEEAGVEVEEDDEEEEDEEEDDSPGSTFEGAVVLGMKRSIFWYFGPGFPKEMKLSNPRRLESRVAWLRMLRPSEKHRYSTLQQSLSNPGRTSCRPPNNGNLSL